MEEIIDKLAEGAGIRVIRMGGLELVRFEDAESLVLEAKRQGYGILGVDGFNLVENDIYPDLDAIADFSKNMNDQSFAARSWAWALEFIQETGAPGKYFEFVFMEERGV